MKMQSKKVDNTENFTSYVNLHRFFDQLPLDILGEIFSYLDITEDEIFLQLLQEKDRNTIFSKWKLSTKIEEFTLDNCKERRLNGKLHSLDDIPCIESVCEHIHKEWYKNNLRQRKRTCG
jgi:hypothetical protein